MSEDGQIDTLFQFLVLGLLGFYLLIGWVFSKLSDETKEKIILGFSLSTPIWIPLAIVQLIRRIPFLVNDQVDFWADLFTLIALFLLAGVYFVVALWPASLSYGLIHSIRELTENKKNPLTTFWTLFDRIKVRRMVTIVLLFTLIILIGLFDLGLIAFLWDTYLGLSSFFVNTVVVVSFVLVLIFLAVELNRYGQVKIKKGSHRRSTELGRMVESLSIAAGVPPPQFRVLAFSAPTAFSTQPNFSNPIIYVTTGLLNLTDKRELEAVIAHEMAHIFSGRLLDYQWINNLLAILRFLGFLLFLLLIASFNPLLIPVWVGIVAYGVLASIGETRIWIGDSASPFDVVLTLANPPFWAINFASYFIYYLLSFDEEFYADLKAVQWTRYPKPLHTVLTKIEQEKRLVETPLPSEFYFLYFTSERTTIKRIPMPQPSIKRRKELLEEIDYTLGNLSVSKEISESKCPACQVGMRKIAGRGHYGLRIDIDQCPSCGGLWFDHWELWYLAELAASVSSGLQRISSRGSKGARGFLCPHCGVLLSLISDSNIPPEIEIWRCNSCNGNWLEYLEYSEYHEYRRHRQRQKDK